GMLFDTGRREGSNAYDHRRWPPPAIQRAWGGATLVSVTALCAWTLCSTLADTGGADQIDLNSTRGDKLDVAVSRGDKLVILKPSKPAFDVALSSFDTRFSLGLSVGAIANSTLAQDDANLLVSTSTQSALSSDPMSLGERIAQKAVLPRPRPASA